MSTHKHPATPGGAYGLTVSERVDLLIQTELAEVVETDQTTTALLKAFDAARCPPFETNVQFSGGLTQRCWQVTRSDGDYAVIYMPNAGYFALCVDSALGPLDIGVHGPALGCFGSV